MALTKAKIIEKHGMKQFTIADIRAWSPCYDPSKYLEEDWRGTALDILDDKRIPINDRLWVILRTDLVSEKLMRLFAVWCARQVQHLMEDARSLRALDVAEAFANGEATKDELDAAWVAAGAVARAATVSAAWAAAWAATEVATEDATRAAAGVAAWVTAGDAQEKKLRDMLIAGTETGDTKIEMQN